MTTTFKAELKEGLKIQITRTENLILKDLILSLQRVMETFVKEFLFKFYSPLVEEKEFEDYMKSNLSTINSQEFLTLLGEELLKGGKPTAAFSEVLSLGVPYLSLANLRAKIFPGGKNVYHFQLDPQCYILFHDTPITDLLISDDDGKNFFHHYTENLDLESSTLRGWISFFGNVDDLRSQIEMDNNGNTPLDNIIRKVEPVKVGKRQPIYRDNTEPLAPNEKNVYPVKDFYRVVQEFLSESVSSRVWVDCHLLKSRPTGAIKTFLGFKDSKKILAYLRKYSLPLPWCRKNLVNWTNKWYRGQELDDTTDEIMGLLLAQFPAHWYEIEESFCRRLLQDSFNLYWGTQGLWISFRMEVGKIKYRDTLWVFALLTRAQYDTLLLLVPHYHQLDSDLQDSRKRYLPDFLFQAKKPAGEILRPSDLKHFSNFFDQEETPFSDDYVDHYAIFDTLRVLECQD